MQKKICGSASFSVIRSTKRMRTLIKWEVKMQKKICSSASFSVIRSTKENETMQGCCKQDRDNQIPFIHLLVIYHSNSYLGFRVSPVSCCACEDEITPRLLHVTIFFLSNCELKCTISRDQRVLLCIYSNNGNLHCKHQCLWQYKHLECLSYRIML